jgi:phospholipid N-methyltransferase
MLIRRILRFGDVRSARTIVELGPGTGVVTKEMLRHMAPTARLLAMEINPLYLRTLRQDIQDPRFTVVGNPAVMIAEALDAIGVEQADLVVSGIPFSTIPKAEAQDTLRHLRDRLSPQGRFLAYQFRSEVRRLAEPILGPSETYQGYWNIPPMRIYLWRNRPPA